MESEDYQTVSLPTIGNGAASELFEDELARVLENILDVNTEPDAVRSITLTVKIRPTKDRDMGAVSIEAKSKLAPFFAADTTWFMGRHKGKAVAVDRNPAQQDLFKEEDPKPRSIKEEGAS